MASLTLEICEAQKFILTKPSVLRTYSLAATKNVSPVLERTPSTPSRYYEVPGLSTTTPSTFYQVPSLVTEVSPPTVTHLPVRKVQISSYRNSFYTQ